MTRSSILALDRRWRSPSSSVRAAEPVKPSTEDAVLLSPVALPIVVDGRLANYIFVTVKVVLTPSADSLSLRDKEPYFRDALVRAAHRTPFVLANDYNHIDVARLRSVMLREASAITGQNIVRDVVIVEQTPQHHLASPHPSTAGFRTDFRQISRAVASAPHIWHFPASFARALSAIGEIIQGRTRAEFRPALRRPVR